MSGKSVELPMRARPTIIAKKLRGRCLNFLLICLAVMSVSTTEAQLTYATNNGAITVTGYSGPAGVVTIPSVVNGQPVTLIGPQSFYGQTNLTSVTIPNSVVEIGENAFAVCSSLSGVTIPASVASIDEDAFSQCSSLAAVTLTNGLESIGIGAFSGCAALAGVAIPGTVTNIGVETFLNCGALASIAVNSNNMFYSSANGVLFDEDRTTLIAFPANVGGGYAIPGGVAAIETYAFFGCAKLGSVTIPGSVTNIADFAFYDCPNVTNFFFGGIPPSLGQDVFLSDTATIYHLPGASGWVSPFGGLTVVLWNPSISSNGANFGAQGNQFQFNVTGTANIPIVVESGTDLGGANWTPLQAITLTNGSFHFSQPILKNSATRFFRIRSP